MNLNRSSLSRAALVFCMAMFVGFLVLGAGCSSKDEILGDATAEAVESGLNEVLTSTVVPLFGFYDVVEGLASGGVGRSSLGGGAVCPDMNSVCAGGGSGACTVTGGGFSLSFDFSSCVVVTGELPLTLSGNLVVTPGEPIQLTFNGLVINGSPAMNGPGSVSVVNCAYTSNVSTDDPASILGTIFQCDTDDYPTAQSQLTISLDDVVINFTFNGSSVASAAASQGGSLIANCSVNLDTLSSSCQAP